MPIDRRQAGVILRRLAVLLEVNGDDPHRVRAFANGARAVERSAGDLGARVASGDILNEPGIGKGIASFLAELAEDRQPALLTELEARIPVGVQELLAVPGLGPKRIRALWLELGISSPGELEYACTENRLAELPGFGAASQQRVLDSLRFLARARDHHLLPEVWAVGEQLAGLLGSTAGVVRAEVAGEVRRGCETPSEVDVVAVAAGPEPVLAALAGALPGLAVADSGLLQGVHASGVACRVRVVGSRAGAVALLLATGSEEHLRQLRRRADDASLSLSEDGLWRGGELVECPDEAAVYRALGLQWVPPELREGEGELELAGAGRLPELVRVEDLRGALHNHTVESDGRATLEEMATAAGRARWQYLGIADHSASAHYANGLDAERLDRQLRQIDGLNRSGSGPRLLKGLEADVRTDGELDVPPGFEERLEYVVASVHTGFRLAREAQTARVLRAIRHPACRILGHPSGRLLLARPGYEVDLEQVLVECAGQGVAVEINASPYRLDLDWRWTRRALALGLRVAINPDAHDVEGLADVRWGVMVARKAGAIARDVVNVGDIDDWLRSR